MSIKKSKLGALMAMSMMFDGIGSTEFKGTYSPTRQRKTEGRLTPLTKKQKKVRRKNKIGRKTRKLNFKK